ncbi:antiterminator LoaP [Paenibacillus glacialis]|uniref:NusG-like N-terminal domain-containing protein n=1 Tax=Paenibacillus glacialis TaxID=494026 RepID=A0A168KSK0_9BACL|nr:antiterminator LoaP [Paenibacillus glacialis]OAB42410.1 hypothetical protein PGLA_12100 [Paenibacillus glacialis]
MNMNMDMDWYALFVKNGREVLIADLLNKRFCPNELSFFIPKRRVPEKREGRQFDTVKMLLPGYVLINTNMTNEIYYKLKKIPHIFRMLNKHETLNEEVHYYKIERREMEPIIQMSGGDGCIDYSDIKLSGTNIVVVNGPLKGMESQIKKIDKHKKRAKLQLDFLGKRLQFDVGINIINPTQE